MKRPVLPTPPHPPTRPSKTILQYGGHLDILDDGTRSLQEVIDALPSGVNTKDVYININRDYDYITIGVTYYKEVENINYDNQMHEYEVLAAKHSVAHAKYLKAKKIYEEENVVYLRWAAENGKSLRNRKKAKEIKMLEKKLAKLKGKKQR